MKINYILILIFALSQYRIFSQTDTNAIQLELVFKFGYTAQNYPFELRGHNNSTITGSAISSGAIFISDIILSKGDVGLITTYYARISEVEYSFFEKTFELENFSSGAYASLGILTGIYLQGSNFESKILNKIYGKLQFGISSVYYPEQEFIYPENESVTFELLSIAIEPQQDLVFASLIGVGTSINLNKKSKLLFEVNFNFESGAIFTQVSKTYDDVFGTNTETMLTEIDWNINLLTFNLGIPLSIQ